VLIEEQVGLGPRPLDVRDRIGDHDVRSALEEVAQEGALADLPGARDDHRGELLQQTLEATSGAARAVDV